MIVGICGRSGSGKDTSADFLVKNAGFVKVAFADPLKRICQEVYDFTDDQLWGPSASRNAPDKRYIRRVSTPPPGWAETIGYSKEEAEESLTEYLTPRLALQLLGTEWARNCYPNTWVDLALRTAQQLLRRSYVYDAKRGLRDVQKLTLAEKEELGPMMAPGGVVISDIRYKCEFDAVKKAGGFIFKLLRGEGLKGVAGQHSSEIELQSIPLESFDCIIDNREWSLDKLEAYLHNLVQNQLRKR
jgi:hypothetical protein